MEERSGQDSLLVEAARGGDQAAFGTLVARYQRLVASVAWRYGTRREDVEDRVSEVFLKVYRNLDRYRPEHPFSTWLYRLAVNHMLDHGRRSRREPPRAELSERIGDPSAGAGEGLLADERAELLRAALASLPPRYREPLFLVYVEGLKVEEAARVLALPEGTLKTRLLRGREALRKVLTERHPRHFEA